MSAACGLRHGRIRAGLGTPSLAAVLMCVAAGCTSIVQRAGITWLYREAKHPDELVLLDVSYVQADVNADAGAGQNLDKQRLDFFRPVPATDAESAEPWPLLVFVHGGGWTFGDRAQVTGGADIYRNVGRYFASHGVGTAVISYRLQPGATWRQQVEDVGHALAWARTYAAQHGGDADAVFLSGHSAGAHLSARYALDPAVWAATGGGPVCGLLLVSGAAYDLGDEETYALGASRVFFEERFGGRAGTEAGADADALMRASVVPLVGPGSPPALVMNAAGEQAKFKRQGDLLTRAYEAAGAPVARMLVPGEDHERMALAISRDDKTAGPAMRAFIARARCTPAPAPAPTPAPTG
jgi:acetyl esterase/lipase